MSPETAARVARLLPMLSSDKAGEVAAAAAEATAEAYPPPASQAIGFRHDVAIVETLPEREAGWLALVERAAPLANVLISRPLPETLQ